jgi:hypothetical protein
MKTRSLRFILIMISIMISDSNSAISRLKALWTSREIENRWARTWLTLATMLMNESQKLGH